MRKAFIDDLQGNEIVARGIFDEKGRQLISAGTSYKISYGAKLKKLGIYSLYIEDDVSQGIEIKDVISEQTRLQAAVAIKEISKKITSRNVDLRPITDIASKLIEEILYSNCIYDISDIKINDTYTFNHSVNVCVLATITAVKCGFDKEKIKKIAIGCMLHDFGKIQIEPEILNKPDKLSDSELIEMKKHTIYGYEAIKKNDEISAISKIIILMHHEKIDGTGYPFGYKGDKIHEGVKIASVCDVFDALTSDRPYRKAWPVHKALQYINAEKGLHFDSGIVNTFFENVAVYPTGSIILLSDGKIGIIYENNPKDLLRPKVKLLYNPKTKIKYSHILDLSEEEDLGIVKEVRYVNGNYVW